MGQVSVVTISYDGKMEIPPVWVPVHDRTFWWPRADSRKVLENTLKYLSKEEDLSSTRK